IRQRVRPIPLPRIPAPPLGPIGSGRYRFRLASSRTGRMSPAACRSGARPSQGDKHGAVGSFFVNVRKGPGRRTHRREWAWPAAGFVEPEATGGIGKALGDLRRRAADPLKIPDWSGGDFGRPLILPAKVNL